MSDVAITQLKSPPIIILAVGGCNRYGSSLFKNFSHSCLFAVPDGAYMLISSVPLYSAAIARPDGNLVTFVRVMSSFANIAVPRMEAPMLWCVSYPPMFVVSRLVTLCKKDVDVVHTQEDF